MPKVWKLRVNVNHNRVAMKQGEVCPEEFVETLKAKGLLEEGFVDALPEVAPVAPVGAADPSSEGEGSEEGEDPQGDDAAQSEGSFAGDPAGEGLEAPKPAPKRRAKKAAS